MSTSPYGHAHSSGHENSTADFECASGNNDISPSLHHWSNSTSETTQKLQSHYSPKSSSVINQQPCETQELTIDRQPISVNRRPPTIDSVKRAIFERPKDWKTRIISLAEVKSHSTVDDCWITAKGKVFNATPFISVHPGGQKSIIRRAGGAQDASVDFDFHSASGQKIWKQYQIGILEGHESSCAVM